MSPLRVNLLGRTEIEVDGRRVPLSPLTTALLVRLLLAEGAWVPLDALYRDVWPDGSARVNRLNRTSVQKRISELRKLIDHESGTGRAALLTDRGPRTRYRLALDRDQVDLHRYRDLVREAAAGDAVTAVELLTEALELWRDQPLADLPAHPSVAAAVARLTAEHTAARLALMEACTALGRIDEALRIGVALQNETPDDGDLVAAVDRLRRQRRTSAERVLVRRDLADPPTSLRVTVGDLFEQDDANLVVGFSDTFDTAVEQDLVISSTSVQGQLLQRVYAGDRDRLDQDLRRGLRGETPLLTERPQDKPRGKRVRYPIGTVVVLLHGSRRIFAVAYGRIGNDLVTRSSLTDLRLSLENLWAKVHQYGQLDPVAVPLVGSGLARITGADASTLLTLIARTFVASSRAQPVSREVRLVVRPEAVRSIDWAALSDAFDHL